MGFGWALRKASRLLEEKRLTVFNLGQLGELTLPIYR